MSHDEERERVLLLIKIRKNLKDLLKRIDELEEEKSTLKKEIDVLEDEAIELRVENQNLKDLLYNQKAI
jgi:regulator of replication initiation timing